MESKLTRGQIQAWNNFIKAFHVKKLNSYVFFDRDLITIKADRIIIPCSKEIESFLDSSPEFKRDPIILKGAHPGAYASWRECVTTFSMQLWIFYENGNYFLGADCDYGRPFYDVVGWSIHAFEFMYNKISGKITDPFKVRVAWNKRGYGIPLVNEA